MAAMGGPGLLHAFVRGRRLILQHTTAHANGMAEAHRQAARAILVRATRRVLQTEARGRAQVALTSHALHRMLLNFIAHRKALVLADTPHPRMYGAAARRDLCTLIIQTGNPPPPPLSAAEQAQSSEYAVPIPGARRVFQLLRPHKRTRSISELGEREAASSTRGQGLPRAMGGNGGSVLGFEHPTRALEAEFDL